MPIDSELGLGSRVQTCDWRLAHVFVLWLCSVEFRAFTVFCRRVPVIVINDPASSWLAFWDKAFFVFKYLAGDSIWKNFSICKHNDRNPPISRILHKVSLMGKVTDRNARMRTLIFYVSEWFVERSSHSVEFRETAGRTVLHPCQRREKNSNLTR